MTTGIYNILVLLSQLYQLMSVFFLKNIISNLFSSLINLCNFFSCVYTRVQPNVHMHLEVRGRLVSFLRNHPHYSFEISSFSFQKLANQVTRKPQRFFFFLVVKIISACHHSKYSTGVLESNSVSYLELQAADTLLSEFLSSDCYQFYNFKQ